jgi:hypothetical protein
MKPQKITPSMAQDILSHNDNNRPLNPRTLSRYIDEMKEGRWMFNGDTISIDRDGNLLNGQHRLTAVVQSGVTIDGLIVEGLDPEAFTTMDIGRRRTGADALIIAEDAKNATCCSAACTHIISYKEAVERNAPYRRVVRNGPVRHDQIIDTYNAYPRLYEYIRHGARQETTIKFIPLSMYAAIRLMMDEIDEKASADFWDKFETGANLGKSNPINALRSRFIGHMSQNAGRKMDRNLSFNLVCRAWNLWRSGKQASKLNLETKDSCRLV